MPVTSKDLRQAGFLDPLRAESFLAGLPGDPKTWVRVCARCADPDLAVLTALRLAEADPPMLSGLIDEGGDRLARLVGVLGASPWWGDHLVAEPSRAEGVWVEPPPARRALLESLGADPGADLPIAAPRASADDMRRAYRRVLLDLVADDLASPDPVRDMPSVGRRLSDLADAALEAALALARRDIDPEGRARLAVIAMGKTGARELNYVSDVDVVYVVEPAEGVDEREAVELGARLAAIAAQACSGAGAEQPLWTVDANLRPEGRNGVLVRTLDSYVQYWRKWAQNWEFQALLKARPAAGDAELGRRFALTASEFVWSAAGREGFVENARAMRRRVEDSIPRNQADRELKLGRGGLRDVEFTVQLLQLVHGRTDESLRVASTVEAIDALSAGGYVARSDAAELKEHYCFLRAVEHRVQLTRMRRTHLVPTSAAELRSIGRAIDPERFATEADFLRELERVRSRVRELHEEVFYRPIITATAGLSPDEAALDEEGARARLAAIGYIDPNGALGHIGALTRGTSRRALIQRHLLPVFISWLADGADPDLGLLSFRTLSEQIGDSHWYLALLRDSGVAASRLCRMLPNSRWIAEALSTAPEAVAWLDSDADLEARTPAALGREVDSLIGRHPDAEDAAARTRAVRSRELLRSAMADLLIGIAPTRKAIAQATDAALIGALNIAQREDAERHGADRARVVFFAMGRYGGSESSYASDADVIACHAEAGGASPAEAAESATWIVNRVKALLGRTTSQMSVALDLDLRPEGRSGPMSRTVDSLRDYYSKWSSTWERQALLRARPVAGPAELIASAGDAIDALRWSGPLGAAGLKEIRLLKARMESERLPRGAEPARHVKLGPGGLSDVEWVVQLLQLRLASDHPAFRSPSTMEALEALVAEGAISAEDGEVLSAAWSLASRIRAGNVLTTGRMSGAKLDALPRDARELIPLARVLGYRAGSEADLEEDWMRAARRSRAVMDRLFWE